MNRFFTILLSYLFLVIWNPLSVRADEIDEIAALIKAGNAKEIAKFIENEADLTISGQAGTYNKAQAEGVLRDFFTKHQPGMIKLVHKITSNPTYKVAVFQLNTTSGSYRVSVSIKTSDNRMSITEIRIENQ